MATLKHIREELKSLGVKEERRGKYFTFSKDGFMLRDVHILSTGSIMYADSISDADNGGKSFEWIKISENELIKCFKEG